MRLYLLYYMKSCAARIWPRGMAAGEGQEWMRFGELFLSWGTGVHL